MGYITSAGAFLAHSLLVALVWIQWESVLCSSTLPSRQTTSLVKENSWGASTVKGLAFGESQRLGLDYQDDLVHVVPSYNEIMLQHRQQRVPRWKYSDMPRSQAAHLLLDCLARVQTLQDEAGDYQWTTVSKALRSPPLSQLEPAASALRTLVDTKEEQVVGFDWGSCAWRHCGALADAQEALDELEHLMGVLEPYEAVFCLDVVERSIRDILASINWDNGMDATDAKRWSEWPAYTPRTSQSTSIDGGIDRIDDEFIRTLRDMRVD